MTFTDDQFERLAPFEHHFITVTRSNYAGYIGYRNAERLHAVLKEAGLCTPNHRTSYTCSRCVMDLLRKAAVPWLADKEERIAAANDAAAAATYEAPQPARMESPDPEPAKTAKAAKTARKSSKPKTTKK